MPDLDKLVKLCDLFEVSMDELVRERSPEQESVVQKKKNEEPDPVLSGKRSAKTRITVGIVLICVAMLGIRPVLSIMNDSGWFFIAGSAVIAFFVGGIVCLSVRKRTALWTFWSMVFSCYTTCAIENTVVIWNLIRKFPGNAYQLAPNIAVLIVMLLLLTATVLLVRKRKEKS